MDFIVASDYNYNTTFVKGCRYFRASGYCNGSFFSLKQAERFCYFKVFYNVDFIFWFCFCYLLLNFALFLWNCLTKLPELKKIATTDRDYISRYISLLLFLLPFSRGVARVSYKNQWLFAFTLKNKQYTFNVMCFYCNISWI